MTASTLPHGFGQPQGFGFVFEYLPGCDRES
jgi:hypothetical protein